MNKVVLIGRLTKDPELKFTPGNGTAVTTANYMTKGRLMAISGRIQTRSYDGKDGTKRYVTEVVANEVSFLSYRKQGSIPSFDDMTPTDDGDIPF